MRQRKDVFICLPGFLDVEMPCVGKFCSRVCCCVFLKQPGIILLKEGTDSSQGVPQLISNINACQFIADAVRTTLGPRGMDKLIVNSAGSC